MAHITLSNKYPGIVGLLAQYPETARPLNLLAETLLRGPSTLSSGERELVAAYVSLRNDCHFCHSSHAAAASAHLKDDYKIIDAVISNYETAPISDKMKALLNIAGKVQKGGKYVTAEDIERAKQNGATDDELHTVVLISAAFCMYNRYVDGLGTWAPPERVQYAESGKMLAEHGYVNAVS